MFPTLIECSSISFLWVEKLRERSVCIQTVNDFLLWQYVATLNSFWKLLNHKIKLPEAIEHKKSLWQFHPVITKCKINFSQHLYLKKFSDYFGGLIQKWIEMVFCYQKCSDLLWEKIVLVIEKNSFLRSLEQFIQTVKGQNNFW